MACLGSLTLRVGQRDYCNKSALTLGRCSRLDSLRRGQCLLGRPQLASGRAEREVGLRDLEYEFVVNGREARVGHERVCPRRLKVRIAPTKVEQQPFECERRNDLARVGDEVALRYEV